MCRLRDAEYARTVVGAGLADVLSAPDVDSAVRIAKLHPATRDGGLEVRPLFVPPAE